MSKKEPAGVTAAKITAFSLIAVAIIGFMGGIGHDLFDFLKKDSGGNPPPQSPSASTIGSNSSAVNNIATATGNGSMIVQGNNPTVDYHPTINNGYNQSDALIYKFRLLFWFAIVVSLLICLLIILGKKTAPLILFALGIFAFMALASLTVIEVLRQKSEKPVAQQNPMNQPLSIARSEPEPGTDVSSATSSPNVLARNDIKLDGNPSVLVTNSHESNADGMAVSPARVGPILDVSTNVLDFGYIVDPVSTKTNVFTIWNAGGGVLTGTASTLPPYSILSGTNYSLGANQTQVVAVMFNPMLLMSSTNNFVMLTGGGGGRVKLALGEGPAPPTNLQAQAVPLLGSASPILAVSTNAVDFGMIEQVPGLAATNVFTIWNAGSGVLTGTASAPSPYSILSGANYDLSANQTQIVAVVFDPLQPMPSTNNFVILTGAGDVSVRLTGWGVPAPPTGLQAQAIPLPEITRPILALSTNAVDFGTVSAAVTNIFTVWNAGGGVLTGTATTSPPYAIVSGANYNLDANQSQVVTVVFNPPQSMSSSSANSSVTLTGGGGGKVKLKGQKSDKSDAPTNLHVTS